MIKLMFSLLFLFALSNRVQCQIIDNSTPKTDKDNKKETSEQLDKKEFTTVYLSVGYFNTFRQFEDQTPFTVKKEWESQTPTKNFGFNLGFYIPLAKHFDLDIGFNYLPYGEAYNYKDSLSDSTFQYINKYQQVGLPIRLKFTFFNEKQTDLGFKPFISVGVVPSNILSIRYFSNYTVADGTPFENEVQKITKDLSGFVLSTTASLGLVYKAEKVSLKIMPEFRYNISNSYIGVFWKHNLWAWGINAGIEFDF